MRKVFLRLVVVEPQTGLNLGMLARLCKNFEVNQLCIVNPKLCGEDWEDAYKFSSHAQEVLDRAVICKKLEEAFKDMDLIVATSAIYRLRGGNILRRPITLSELYDIIIERGIRNVAIILGRETTGLTNEEISKCDLMLTIEANEKYPTLNITHAAAIILYYFYVKILNKRIRRKIAPRELREKIIEILNEIAKEVVYEERFRKLMIASFKNILQRGSPDYREAGLVLRLFKFILDLLKEKQHDKD